MSMRPYHSKMIGFFVPSVNIFKYRTPLYISAIPLLYLACCFGHHSVVTGCWFGLDYRNIN